MKAMEYSNFRRYRLLALLSVMMGAAACLSEEEFRSDTETVGGGADEIMLNAEIAQQYVTRANDNGFADGDKIGVFVVNYKDGKPQDLALTGNHADNVKFTYNDKDGKWTGASPLYWADKTTPVDAYGYHPFDEELSSVTAYPFSIHRNQSATVGNTGITGYEASDFLWCKSEGVLPSSRQITLRHNHIMAGVQVTLVKGFGFEDEEWETLEKQVMVENTKLDATIDITEGRVSPAAGSSAQSIISMASGSDFRAIVVPQTIPARETLISVTVDGRSSIYRMATEMTYHPGRLHKFTFEVAKLLPVGDYRLTLIDEAVLPWQNDPVSHNGAAKEYITVHVDEGEYIGDVISSMGIDPKEIINLKLTGTLAQHDHFRYIRERMPYLEAVNLKELRTKDQRSYYWDGGRVEPSYGQPQSADDYIPREAFKNMKYLSYVVWPDHLVGIAEGAFLGCNLRGSLIFPEGLKHIGGSVFEGWNNQNSALTGELYLPSTLEYVGGDAFNSHDSPSYLTGEFVLPSGIKYIGENAFGPCRYLTGKVQIPEKLDILNKGAFPDNLTGDVSIPQGIKVVNGISRKITSVYFPEGVEEVGDWAFEGVSTLKGDIHFPSTIKRIGESSFSHTSISHISLPEGLDIIEYGSFYDCKFLQDTLIIPSATTKIKGKAFQYCEKLTAVVLPVCLMSVIRST